MNYKIYGETYELMPTSTEAPDAFAVHGKLLDEKPSGKFLGYVEMEDGSTIACFKKSNPLVIILPVGLLTLIGVCVGVYFMFMQPKDVVIDRGDGDTPISVKTGDDNNVISYNGFMSVHSDGNVGIGFTNGDYECTLTLEGDGINTVVYTAAPGEVINTLPITYTTTSGLVSATLTVQTATSTTTNDVVIEIPDNNTPNSPDVTLEGYWKGEYIYGTQPVE